MVQEFKAYWDRRVAIHNNILHLAKEIANKGFRVITLPNRRITFVVVIDDNNSTRTTFGFSECPYKWYIDGGSAISGANFPLLDGDQTYIIPFGMDEVISKMYRFAPSNNRYVHYVSVNEIEPIL